MKRAAISLVAMALLALSMAAAGEPASGGTGAVIEVQAITKPSQDVTLSFTHPGRVATMLVKEGDVVKAGQLLAKQDDTEEQAALDVAQAQADDNTRVEAQEKVRDQKEKAYENKKASGSASQSELDEALLDSEVAKANVRLSNFEHMQDGRKALQAKATLEKTRLKSPIDGIVMQTKDGYFAKAGESVDGQNMKVLRVVSINPLWIDVPVPFAAARSLKDAAPARVKFSSGDERPAKVIFVAPVADSASDTLLVRVQVENAENTPAGERVTVVFNGGKAVASK